MAEYPLTGAAAHSLAARLISGGDHRLVLTHGLNAYGCPPLPDPDLCALGSCTASPVSASALQAITPLHHRLQQGEPAAALWPGMLAAWLTACGLPPDTRITPAGSGTELHGQFLTELRRRTAGRALHVVTVNGNETGRGVPALLEQADHVNAISLRDTDGTARPREVVNEHFQTAIRTALQQGAHCLVITSDLSKSGLQAPDPDSLLPHATAQAQGQLTVLVDACQFRCTRNTLSQYLQRGWWVAVTGSKFIGGPSFSGLLLHAREQLPEALPENPGLLLRTAAALHELQGFQRLPEAQVAQALDAFAHTVQQGLGNCGHLHLLPQPALHRPTASWDAIQSIFLVTIRANGQMLDAQGLQDFRQRLWAPDMAGPRLLLGQPVELAPGYHALRLCSSARWVMGALANGLDAACAALSGQILHLDRQAKLAVAG